MSNCFRFAWIFLISGSVCFSQTPDSSLLPVSSSTGAIKASVQVDQKEVPQNRAITFTIRISWQGDLNRYEIEKIESPILTNLEELGNSSSNSVGEVAGVMQALKTYEYILQPIDLGMAYIDGTIVEYKDTEFDQTHRLLTDRLEIKVVDPIKEKNLMPFVWAALFLFVIGLGFSLFVILQKKKKDKQLEMEKQAQELIPVEEKFISELKETVDLKSQDVVATFSSLSRLLKRYLSEKYDIPAMEVTTKEITVELNKLAVSENTIGQVDEILNSCDVAKFSGGKVEGGSVERVYTLVEDTLSKNKSDHLIDIQKEEK